MYSYGVQPFAHLPYNKDSDQITNDKYKIALNGNTVMYTNISPVQNIGWPYAYFLKWYASSAAEELQFK